MRLCPRFRLRKHKNRNSAPIRKVATAATALSAMPTASPAFSLGTAGVVAVAAAAEDDAGWALVRPGDGNDIMDSAVPPEDCGDEDWVLLDVG